ncbi:hypothetical protein THII_0134 [Thioploca ingrica]|uniref:Uncharacterized protein n=1 Tax=Thioploca ingrica TaxID=40754 RepID=A0A090BU38_9GAMM|nr:hypothetical protein THII_0134 [Thioploca ingrica]
MVFLQFFIISSIAGTLFLLINQRKNNKALLNIITITLLSLSASILILSQIPWPQKNPLMVFILPVWLLTVILSLEGLIIGQQLYQYQTIAKYYFIYITLFIFLFSLAAFLSLTILTAFYPYS